MLDSFLAILKIYKPDIKEKDLSLSFSELDIDSFDILELRSSLENTFKKEFSDNEWVNFSTPIDILNSLPRKQLSNSYEEDNFSISRTTKINMPQMAVGGLGESWLLKELGDMHWELIGKGLRTQSDQISDSLGNRLYATFVRLRFEALKPLVHFNENEILDFKGKIERFGKNLFISSISSEFLKATLLSSFVSRSGDNSSLMKGEVIIDKNCNISELSEIPAFSIGYKNVRRSNYSDMKWWGFSSKDEKEILFEKEYFINPYFDFNGVNLLYFAAYPLISDKCERSYFNSKNELEWTSISSTKCRDIFYFCNCEIDDIVVYRIHFIEETDKEFFISSSLYRKSDGLKMATIMTQKTKV